MKLEGCLPVIRMTASIVPGRIRNLVKIHGPRGGLKWIPPVTPRDPSKARRAPTGKRAV